jgi:hypothetical protein
VKIQYPRQPVLRKLSPEKKREKEKVQQRILLLLPLLYG